MQDSGDVVLADVDTTSDRSLPASLFAHLALFFFCRAPSKLPPTIQPHHHPAAGRACFHSVFVPGGLKNSPAFFCQPSLGRPARRLVLLLTAGLHTAPIDNKTSTVCGCLKNGCSERLRLGWEWRRPWGERAACAGRGVTGTWGAATLVAGLSLRCVCFTSCVASLLLLLSVLGDDAVEHLAQTSKSKYYREEGRAAFRLFVSTPRVCSIT